MMAAAISSSPAPGAFKSQREELEYYKAQYAHLATELHDFQETSRELEAELERDAEAAEQREKNHKAKIEALGYEVEEWKTKYGTSKKEANTAQASLQKEITTLRDTNRTQQLKVRDMEVANDDFERQARNTTSSLEDIFAKYDTALERNVLLEEEIKMVEQEREQLRIEVQRVRDELSDLRVETDILSDKLRPAEGTKTLSQNSLHAGVSSSPSVNSKSPLAAHSTKRSAPITAAHDANTPPSPPLSEASASAIGARPTSSAITKPTRISQVTAPNGQTRYEFATGSEDRAQRSPLVTTAPAFARPDLPRKPRASMEGQPNLPRSGSLYQLKGLRGRMLKLEERVQAVKSKLPASATSQGGSPHSEGPATAMLPPTITVRRSSRRPSEFTGLQQSKDSDSKSPAGKPSYRPSSRLSYGPGAHEERVNARSYAPADSTTLAPKYPANPPLASGSRPGSRLSRASISRLAEQESGKSVNPIRNTHEQNVAGRRATYGQTLKEPRQPQSVDSAASQRRDTLGPSG